MVLLSLKREGKKLYSLEKIFSCGSLYFDEKTWMPRQREYKLYHLDTANFNPF